jgi:hypothetical protein
MTRKQRNDLERPWLKQEILVVSKKLGTLLSTSSLTDTEKRQRALIHHMIIRDSEDVGLYHNVSSRVLGNLLGNNYSTVLKWMVQNQCLDINQSYSSDVDKGFTKSYRIPGLNLKNRLTETTFFTFNHPRIIRVNDGSDPTDDVSKFVLTNLNRLTVRKELVHIEDTHRRIFGLEYSKWVYHKRFDVKYGENSKRLSHTVIRMVKEARVNLILEETGESLVYFDVTACYPNLLPFWIHDPSEKSRFVEILKEDFYGVLASSSKSKSSRDRLKGVVSRFLCDKKHPSNNIMGRWLETNFPNLFNTICNTPSMALSLQNLEADLFVQKLGRWAMTNQVWYVPMYDGFLCLTRDALTLRQQAESIFESIVGHRPLLREGILKP